jgi:hypothetical protein
MYKNHDTLNYNLNFNWSYRNYLCDGEFQIQIDNN